MGAAPEAPCPMCEVEGFSPRALCDLPRGHTGDHFNAGRKLFVPAAPEAKTPKRCGASPLARVYAAGANDFSKPLRCVLPREHKGEHIASSAESVLIDEARCSYVWTGESVG